MMEEECDHRVGVRHRLEVSLIKGPWSPVSRWSTGQATLAAFDHVEEVLQRDDSFS